MYLSLSTRGTLLCSSGWPGTPWYISVARDGLYALPPTPGLELLSSSLVNFTVFLEVQGIRSRASHVLAEYSTTELHP